MDSNSSYATYLPALRKMASLSQLPQTIRPSRRSPNATLSRRSGIMKPFIHNSPARNGQRRRSIQSQNMARPATYHAENAPLEQASAFSQAHGFHMNANSQPSSRPVTWHPSYDMHHLGMASQFDVTQPQYNEPQAWQRETYMGPTETTMPFPTTGTASIQTVNAPIQHSSYGGQIWFDESSAHDNIDGNAIPINNLNLNHHPASAQIPTNTHYNMPRHTTPYIINANTYTNSAQHADVLLYPTNPLSNDVTEGEEEPLVGMGLHDRSTNYDQPSLLLGAGLDEHEKPSTRPTGFSTLIGGWSPPEQVPDTIPDEGNDSPVTNDFQYWSSPADNLAATPHDAAQLYPNTTNYDSWAQQPMYDMSGQTFFLDDSNEQSYQTQWYPPQTKSLGTEGMSMNTWDWTGSQYGS